MTTTKHLNDFCEIIDSYGGRDKVMKALCYSAKLISGYQSTRNPDLAKRYAIFSARISGARATLRLIDDIPMLRYAIEYGLGEKEPDQIMATLGVTGNIIDLLFYPVEKICWLSEHRILDVKDPSRWDFLNSLLWSLSIYLNLMRTLRNYCLNESKKVTLSKESELKPDSKALMKQQIEMISIARLALDFAHAVSTLPKGYLWGGKLSTFQVGAIGTTSALLGIFQIFAKRKLSK